MRGGGGEGRVFFVRSQTCVANELPPEGEEEALLLWW